MRNKKDINVIWKHTFKDYRGYIGESKAIMYYDNSNGSVLCAIEKLPEKVFDERLEAAERKENAKR